MRIRTIKPEFWKSETVAELSPMARLLFIGLWNYADREGRMEDRPKRIKAEIFPYDNLDVEILLEELYSHDFVTRYTVEGHRYIAIPKFLKHQRPNEREIKSVLPALPAEHNLDNVEHNLDTHASIPIIHSLSSIPIFSPLILKSDSERGSKERAADGFDEFWVSYPKKVAKEDARKAWKNLEPSQIVRSEIAKDLARRASGEWAHIDPKHIPYPATYLNGKRWTDEIPVARAVADGPVLSTGSSHLLRRFKEFEANEQVGNSENHNASQRYLAGPSSGRPDDRGMGGTAGQNGPERCN